METDTKALFTILKCADSADGQLGRSGMLKLLLGRESRKLSKLRLDHSDEYGSLSFMRKESVLEHIDYLIERGCLHISSFFFPMVHITDVGQERIKRLIRQHGLCILPDQRASVDAGREVGEVYVCDEKGFWRVFLQDLQAAQHEVIIFSPFVSRRRSETLMKDFEMLLSRGVRVRVHTRPPEDLSRSPAAILDTLEGMGVDVTLRKQIHHKAAILDRAIAWEGSLNILQHWDTGEQMTRHDDSGYVKQLLDVLGLKA